MAIFRGTAVEVDAKVEELQLALADVQIVSDGTGGMFVLFYVEPEA